MPKYRKKPVEVEAFQMTPEAMKDDYDWPQWLKDSWRKDMGQFGKLSRDAAGNFYLHTLENKAGREHCVDPYDWIIQGVKGELYPCKPDIFAATYDPVDA